ncbi:uncharacterized protein LOC128555071 [Mercenaria mercenaria]|uniref:uncharacterized protein LOC128555071 n=1 Tax=Mercenaria mercenaria TaxID=6596 RepID=UPI00234F631F|nr:uncharacterized protein LOC128555071 [Mercenaria mercenaria]
MDLRQYVMYSNGLGKPEPSAMLPIPEENDENLIEGTARADVFNFIDESDEEDDLQEEERPKKRKKATAVQKRQKWTKGEEKELQELLRKNFRDVKCPSQAECENARKVSQKSGGLIWKRPRDNIKKKVSNMLKKL